MMRLFLVATLVPLFSLGTASTAEQPGNAPPIQPGQWEFVHQMTLLEAGGVPPAVVRQMRAQLAQPQVQSQCVTPEQARDPWQNVLGNQTPPGCEFSDKNWASGAIRIRAVCRTPDSFSVQLALYGSYTGQQINGQIHLNMELPGPPRTRPTQSFRLQGRMTGRRTGECPTPDPRANENSLAPVN